MSTARNGLIDCPTAATKAAPYLETEFSHQVLDHWCAISQDRPARRAAFDPLEIAPCLSRVYLMTWHPADRELCYELAGEEVEAKYGFSVRGKNLSELVDTSAYDNVSAYFTACIERPAIVILSGRLFQEQEKPGLGERLLLPLFSDGPGEPVDNCVTASHLVGLTVQRREFVDREEAFRNSKRLLHIVPLNGDEVEIKEY